MSSLVPYAYEDGTVQASFVESFINRFFPAGTPYAPTLVLSRLLLQKGFSCLYDEALLSDLLLEAGFEVLKLEEAAIGEITISARVVSS